MMASHASPGRDGASQDGPSQDGPGQDSLARQWRELRDHPLRKLRRLYRWAEFHFRPAASEAALADEANAFWNSPDTVNREEYSHWRGVGVFADDERWLALGRQNLALYQQFARMAGAGPPRRILEWGCGGGANAVHFAPLGATYIGVDIVPESLEECGRQLAAMGHGGFHPVLADPAAPESVPGKVPEPCDLFLCTYVFELLPSADYGLRVLAVARQLLRPGGIAMIQIRYSRHSWTSRAKRFAYRRHVANMTTYPVDVFWMEAEARGLVPLAVRLVPSEPLNGNTNYAYFLLGG